MRGTATRAAGLKTPVAGSVSRGLEWGWWQSVQTAAFSLPDFCMAACTPSANFLACSSWQPSHKVLCRSSYWRAVASLTSAWG